jgi:hypothetical protein
MQPFWLASASTFKKWLMKINAYPSCSLALLVLSTFHSLLSY